MFPTRISLVTYNLWNTNRWPERKLALTKFLQTFSPDILAVQELRPETMVFLDKAMQEHTRIDSDFAGWSCEGNFYWRNSLFNKMEYGAEEVGILEEHRRLFWVRLSLADTGRTFFVGTAHFTYSGHPHEAESGFSPRVRQSHEVGAALAALVRKGEPAFFMGDLNDSTHPTWILHDYGYRSCFSQLGIQPPPTAPSIPSSRIEVGVPITNRTIDWIMSNESARPIAAMVPHFIYHDLSPSDHWPVVAVYELDM